MCLVESESLPSGQTTTPDFQSVVVDMVIQDHIQTIILLSLEKESKTVSSKRCFECSKIGTRSQLSGPNLEKLFPCKRCKFLFCKECGFFDDGNENFNCKGCWLKNARALEGLEEYRTAEWVYRRLGRYRDAERARKLAKMKPRSAKERRRVYVG